MAAVQGATTNAFAPIEPVCADVPRGSTGQAGVDAPTVRANTVPIVAGTAVDLPCTVTADIPSAARAAAVTHTAVLADLSSSTADAVVPATPVWTREAPTARLAESLLLAMRTAPASTAANAVVDASPMRASACPVANPATLTAVRRIPTMGAHVTTAAELAVPQETMWAQRRHPGAVPLTLRQGAAGCRSGQCWGKASCLSGGRQQHHASTAPDHFLCAKGKKC
jgi:hypothetical protein